MNDDLIWAGAIIVRRQYGSEACDIAAMRCEAMLADQDIGGYQVWSAIRDRIRSLGSYGSKTTVWH